MLYPSFNEQKFDFCLVGYFFLISTSSTGRQERKKGQPLQSSGKSWEIKLISLHPTQWYRRRGREGSQVHGLYSRSLWIWSGTLTSPKEEINQHLSDTYSDSRREEELAPWGGSLHHPHPLPSLTPKSLPLRKLERQSGWHRPEQCQGQVECCTNSTIIETHEEAVDSSPPSTGCTAEGKGSQAVVTCRRCLDTKGGDLKWREWVPPEEYLCLHHLQKGGVPSKNI